MNVINTNIGALKAANASNAAGKALGTAMERLSTGKRINSAKDDAAGLAIATSMTSQVRGMNQGIRNANDGISMAQTAEGALNEVTNMLQRQRELVVQASNDTYSATDLANLKSEMDALNEQITNVVTNTEFNGQKLFDATAGTAGVVSVQAGANEADAIDIDLSTDLTTDADLAAAAAVDVTALAAGDIALFDTAIETVSTVRAGLGASQNQLESTIRLNRPRSPRRRSSARLRAPCWPRPTRASRTFSRCSANLPATHITGRRPVARKSGGLLHTRGPVDRALIKGFAFRHLRDNA